MKRFFIFSLNYAKLDVFANKIRANWRLDFDKQAKMDRQAVSLNRQTCQEAKHQIWSISEFLSALWNDQEGACALTYLRFRETDKNDGERRPFIPSVDRIDRREGYIKDNVRLVCVAVNKALFTWGESVLDEIVIARMGRFSISIWYTNV